MTRIEILNVLKRMLVDYQASFESPLSGEEFNALLKSYHTDSGFCNWLDLDKQKPDKYIVILNLRNDLIYSNQNLFDYFFPPCISYMYPIVYVLSIKKLCLKPRIELLQKTIARLEKEIQN